MLICSVVVSNLYFKPKQILNLLKYKNLYSAQSYYPEKQSKTIWSNLWFQIGQIIRYGSPNKYYFSYGLDVKTHEEQKEYVHFDLFFKRICYLNHSLKFNCCAILRDKILFNIFANGIGIETPRNILYSANGHLYSYESKKEILPNDILNLNVRELFCKLIDGECGRGIFKLSFIDGKGYIDGQETAITEIYNLLISARYLAQTIISQHPLMSSLHFQSINSLRLITVKSMKDEVIRIWPSILRIGTGDSIVDNTSQGGLCVGVNFETSKLKKYGFFKPEFGRKTEIHPDSGVKFCEFKVPFLKEAVKQAIYFHSMLPGIQSVGWDIAIGENGPVFIEGNDNWEINGPQICNGGLKSLFKEQMFDK